MIGYCRTKPGLRIMAETLWRHPEITDLIVLTDEPRGMSGLLIDDRFMHDVVAGTPNDTSAELIRIHKQSWASLNTSLPTSEPLHKYLDIVPPPSFASESLWPRVAGYSYASRSARQLYSYVMHQIYRRGMLSTVRNTTVTELLAVCLTLIEQTSEAIMDDFADLFPRNILDEYKAGFDITKEPQESQATQAYSYPSRILSALEVLIERIGTTRAFWPIFWPSDFGQSETPCCVSVQLLLGANKALNMIVTFRSNDMKNAWPLNLLGFRYLHEQILTRLQTREKLAFLGSLTTVSHSAHCYGEPEPWAFVESDFNDPEGYYVVDKSEDNKDVVVKYYRPNAELIKCYQSPIDKYEELIIEVTTDITRPSHAAYVAKEIVRAALLIK